jgi:hypothetical protein
VSGGKAGKLTAKNSVTCGRFWQHVCRLLVYISYIMLCIMRSSGGLVDDLVKIE